MVPRRAGHGLELVLLRALAAVIVTADADRPLTTTAARVGALAAAALAMGLQTDVIRAAAGGTWTAPRSARADSATAPASSCRRR
jgi:hypothetical protein